MAHSTEKQPRINTCLYISNNLKHPIKVTQSTYKYPF